MNEKAKITIIRAGDAEPMLEPSIAKKLDELSERESEFEKLIARRIELAMRTEIADMQEYVKEWAALSIDFQRIDCPANAELCASNAAFYDRCAQQTPGRYVRRRVTGGTTLIAAVKGETKDESAERTPN